MNELLSPWKRIVFKRIAPADIRKIRAESNNAPTGGGARDFRFSPSNQFWTIFERMFPVADGQGNLLASFLWEDHTMTTTLIHPPYNSRSNECRIATVNGCCPLDCLPAEDEENLFLLAQEATGVHAFFVTTKSLEVSKWSARVKLFLRHLFDLPMTRHRTPAGYVDFETNDQFSNTTTLTMNNLPWNEYPPFEPFAYQRIFYGAPGTGKSYLTNEIVAAFSDTIRTTFHPDSDYASFVGCYKPSIESVPRTVILGKNLECVKSTDSEVLKKGLLEERRIVYQFVPQAFTNAYVRAWEKLAKTPADGKPDAQFLVIEEINRGNCAQVFGDLFQLLDRDDAGYSKYPVDPDTDLAKHLHGWFRGEFKDGTGKPSPKIIANEADEEKWKAMTVGTVDPTKSGERTTWADVLAGRKLVLPPNLYIWATMNTSDQSLFPMDSAFKRRWDWKYIPIRNHTEENWAIVIDATRKYDWWDFLEIINKVIFEKTNSEDKQLGYFFVQAKGGVVDLDTFVNKVVFYLWNTVFKDCYTECEFLQDDKDANGAPTYLHFSKFFGDDGKVNPDVADKLLDKLKVKKLSVSPAAPASGVVPAAAPSPATPAAMPVSASV